MSDELRRTLGAAGEQEAPPPDAPFVRDLEARLRDGVAPVSAPAPRRLLPAAAAVLVVAAGIGLAIGLSGGDDPGRVQTEPDPSVTTTVVVPTTTTTTGPAAVTSTTMTVVSHPPTSVPVTNPPPSTTTTTTLTVQDLHLSCASEATGPSMTCTWDRATDPAFASFRLTRRTPDGPENVVYTGDATTFTEPGRPGARVVYAVVALRGDGTVVGRSQAAQFTCC